MDEIVSAPVEARKRAFRARMRSQVSVLSESARREASGQIREELIAHRCFREAAALFAFHSLPSEVETPEIIEAAWSAGTRVLLPRIPGEADAMEFAPVAGFDSLRAGRYGVLEPEPSSLSEPAETGALILVPGLAFDSQGGRLGRGGGYYDRALSAMIAGGGNLTFVGLCFDVQIVDRVPMSAHDVRVDAVLSEAGWRWCEDSQGPA